MKKNISFFLFFLIGILLSSAKGNGFNPYNVSCTVNSEGINFGDYNPFSNTIKRSYGVIKVSCFGAKGVVRFNIKLVGGNSSNPKKRYLYSSLKRSKLFYNLFYKNCIFGDGNYGTCNIHSTITLKDQSSYEKVFIITGIIYPGQNVEANYDYQDVLNIVVEY